MWSAGCGGCAGPVLLGLLLALSVPGGGAAKTGVGFVTCGSVLKLLNTHHRVRLHSHDIKYGSGACDLRLGERGDRGLGVGSVETGWSWGSVGRLEAGRRRL